MNNKRAKIRTNVKAGLAYSGTSSVLWSGTAFSLSSLSGLQKTCAAQGGIFHVSGVESSNASSYQYACVSGD